MMSEERAVIEIRRDTMSRLTSLMSTLKIPDLDQALNDLFDQIEINGWRRRKQAMDAVERIFTLECPYMDRSVPMNQCEGCPYCARIDQVTGSIVCIYGVSRELEFMTTCPRIRSTATVVNCSDCRFGMVSREYGTVVCRYFE